MERALGSRGNDTLEPKFVLDGCIEYSLFQARERVVHGFTHVVGIAVHGFLHRFDSGLQVFHESPGTLPISVPWACCPTDGVFVVLFRFITQIPQKPIPSIWIRLGANIVS